MKDIFKRYWLWLKSYAKRITLKWCFYFVLAAAFIAWSWTTLYIESYGNVWGGKDDAGRAAAVEKKQMLAELADLERRGAQPDLVFDQRVRLSLRCAQSKDNDGARKFLTDERDLLVRLPASEEIFGLQVKIENLLAHSYIDEGQFGEARKSLEKAQAMAIEMSGKYFSEESKLLVLSSSNELAVLTYLEANSTLDGRNRAMTFDKAQKSFEDLLVQIDTLLKDPSKTTDEGRKRLTYMKQHVESNLKLVKEDIANEDEFQKT